jgi:hypothetical protein
LFNRRGPLVCACFRPQGQAQQLNARYLAALDPDRLLHSFRTTAGLPSDAAPYGGWETPGVEVRGHFVGHYLSALAMAVNSTGASIGVTESGLRRVGKGQRKGCDGG